jgi:signal peptidase I
MEPMLRQGDRITIEGTDPSKLRRGDIVVYESPLAGLVVHRLMWKVPPLGIPRVAFTKGDALLFLDRPFAIQEVLGRVVEVERGEGVDRSRRSVAGWRSCAKWLATAAAWGWRNGVMGRGLKTLTHRGKR